MFHYLPGDAAILQANPTYNGDDWSKPIFNGAKETIRKYFCRKQKRLCIYCKTELETACHSEHIEHIVHKASRPIWMFEPFNLGIACSQCNTKKGVKRTMKAYLEHVVTLPLGGQYYLIVHPNFDVYEEHIEIEDRLFVKARNNHKGANTIEMCGLWRPLYADRRARALSIAYSGRYTYALDRIQKPGIGQEEKDAFMDYIDELLDIL